MHTFQYFLTPSLYIFDLENFVGFWKDWRIWWKNHNRYLYISIMGENVCYIKWNFMPYIQKTQQILRNLIPSLKYKCVKSRMFLLV